MMAHAIPHTMRYQRARATRARRGAWLPMLLAPLVALTIVDRAAMGDDEPEAPATGAPAASPASAPVLTSKGKEDPLLRSLIEADPKTAQEITRTVKTLIDVRQPTLAKTYLQRLIALKLPPAESDRLLDEFGTPVFIEITQVPELAAVAGPFVQKLLADAQAFRRDPARLATMIADLGSQDRYTRQTALDQLERSRETGAMAMIGVLADPKRAEQHAAVRGALARMGAAAIGPAESALLAHNPALEARIISLLAKLEDKSAAILMVRAAVDPASPPELSRAAHAAILQLRGSEVALDDGRQALARDIRMLLDAAVRLSGSDPASAGAELPKPPAAAKKGAAKKAADTEDGAIAGNPAVEPPVFADAPILVEVWRWDAKKRAPVLAMAPQAIAWADRADQLAQDLLALDAGDADASAAVSSAAGISPVRPAMAPEQAAQERAARNRLALLARLTAARLDGDLDQPLPVGEGTAHDLAVSFGAEQLNAALAQALADDNPFAAAAAADILGEIGSAELLTQQGARRSPLVDALQSADRRVRFAALGSIVKLAPSVRFPGDGYVPLSLAYFSNTRAAPRVLIGHPRRDMGQYLAGLLAGEGYETDIATSGREMFHLASASPDYDFVLLHYAIRDPQLDDLLTTLRRDPTTRRMPLGLLALSPDLLRAEHIAQSVPPALAMLEPGAATQMAIRTGQLLRLQGRNRVPFAARQRQAQAALGWIGKLVAGSTKTYELRFLTPTLIGLLNVPGFESAAIEPLVAIGGAPAELALLDIADSNVQPLEFRQQAAAAFVRCVERHGILLKRGEIERQYALYNASERSGAEIQAVLAAVLDAIEARGGAEKPGEEKPGAEKAGAEKAATERPAEKPAVKQ